MSQTSVNNMASKGENRKEFQGDASEMAKNATQVGKDFANKSIEDSRKKMADFYESGKSKVADIEKKVSSGVKFRPLQAILIAAGIGLVLGWAKKKKI